MKRSYATELKELPGTYRAVREAALAQPVAETIRAHQPLLHVGSGGALAVARLAADLHNRSEGHLAAAMTPLEASTAGLSGQTGLVLFTARGRNPDAALAIKTARRRGASHLGVVTSRERDELPPALAADDVHVAEVPSPPDGFLATNSLMAMATAVCLAHRVTLPDTLPALRDGQDRPRSPRHACVVVTGPGTAAVGVDLEARLVETGLASVQTMDYRNLAHGRHVGLLRNADNSTIIAVVDPAAKEIADRTLALLPPELDVMILRTDLIWPASVLDLFVSSMKVAAAAGKAAGLDPGRPRVADFGRRLYHLSVASMVEPPNPDPIEKKLRRRNLASATRLAYEEAFASWIEGIQQVDLGAVVLDYDGTVCRTERRYELPVSDVQQQIVRLLDAGILIGFATGRGKSLHSDTRAWLPEKYWPHVHVGLYNGTRLLRLADDPPHSDRCGEHLLQAVERLKAVGSIRLDIEERPTQMSVSTAQADMSGPELLSFVRSVLSRQPILNLKVVASGHSVDIISSDAGKLAVLRSISEEIGGAILAIGDQGQVDGNDFELLASSTTTLSVDRCSEDPTRCWNLDRRGESGPTLLVRYLRSLRVRDSIARFVWCDP